MCAQTVRVAAVQLDYQPAYLGRFLSYLREPSLPEETENALSALVELPGIQEFRESLKAAWIEHARTRLDAILDFCSVREADLVVFPEYSIPAELLPRCREISDRTRMVIVAGSHSVGADESCIAAYAQAGLGHLNLRPLDPDSDIRKSICPIFVPGTAPSTIEKRARSVWESDVTTGRPGRLVEARLRSTTLRLGVLLCIEALRLDELAEVYRAQSRPDLIVIPSLSHSTDPFKSVGQLFLMNEVPTVYANGRAGASKIFAKPGAASAPWPVTHDGVEGFGEGDEGVILAAIDFDERAEVRRTVMPHLGLRVRSYAPLFYPLHSDLSRTFLEMRKRCLDRATGRLSPEALEHFAMLSKADPALLPALLQKKLRMLLTSTSQGSLRADDAELLLETVDVAAGSPTFVLRQLLVQESVEKVSALAASRDSVRNQDTVLKVLRNLMKRRTELSASIHVEPRRATQAPRADRLHERPSTASEPLFLDRHDELSLVRRFVNNPEQRAMILTGIRGIGKTAMIRRAFAQALPGWRCVWIQVPDGVPFQQLVAECAAGLDIVQAQIPTTEEASELAGAILARIDRMEATGLVLDDCDALLGPTGDFLEQDTAKFIGDLVARPSRQNAKVFLLSNRLLPIPEASLAGILNRHLRGLETEDSASLLEYWIRLQGEEVRGQPIEIPPKLLSFLRGHPLAIRIAARLCATYSPEDLMGDLAIFKKLRAAIVEVLLDRVTLTDTQRALLEFASIFRLGVPLSLFRAWGGDAAVLELGSLLSRFLLELADGQYWMHPAVAQYFYEQAHQQKARANHKLAGKFLLHAFNRSRPPDIRLLVEAIHHIAASGDIEQARSLGVHKEELRALARSSYARRDMDASLAYYGAICDTDPNDLDAQAHMALALGRQRRWKEADSHFAKATRIKEACWVYQSYGALKVGDGLETEGGELLMHALDLNPRDSATLASLAVLRLRHRRDREAEELFKESLEENPENTYALWGYAKFLSDRGRKAEARPYAELLVEIEPRNPAARRLLRDISETTPQQPTDLHNSAQP